MRSLTATASLFTRISLLKPQIGCNTLNVGANCKRLSTGCGPIRFNPCVDADLEGDPHRNGDTRFPERVSATRVVEDHVRCPMD
jgi:hypothetical protein